MNLTSLAYPWSDPSAPAEEVASPWRKTDSSHTLKAPHGANKEIAILLAGDHHDSHGRRIMHRADRAHVQHASTFSIPIKMRIHQQNLLGCYLSPRILTALFQTPGMLLAAALSRLTREDCPAVFARDPISTETRGWFQHN